MSKAVYIATMESGSGKSIVTLGLMRMLLGKVAKVGYFKPIISDFNGDKKDNHIDTIVKHFDLDIQFDEAYAFTKSEVLEKQHNGEQDSIIDKVIEKFKVLEERFDFILVEGTDFSGEGTATELKINSDIAKNLGIPAIIVESGADKTMEDFVNNMFSAYDLFEDREVEILAVIANKVKKKNIPWIKNELSKKLPKNIIVNAIPKIKQLANPSIKEVKDKLNAKVLFGEDRLHHEINTFVVGAMQLRNYLPRIKNNSLMVAPGDRADLILGALQAKFGNFSGAIEQFLLALKYDPNSAILYNFLGHAYSDNQQPELSTKYFNKAYELDPSLNPRNKK